MDGKLMLFTLFDDLLRPRSRARINDEGAIVGTATYSGTDTNIAPGSHGVILAPIEFVYEPVKGSGNYVPLKTLPIAQPGSGTSTSSYSTTYGVYQVQLGANLTTTAVGTMTANFQNPTGSFSGTLTETGTNTGVFHDTASAMTLTVPVGTTTSGTNITLTATVTCSALGLSSAPVTLIENGATPLTFTQPQLDIAVVFPSTGLSTTAVDAVTLEYTSDTLHDVVLTETGTNTKVFNSSDNTMSLSITGTTTFSSTAVDTMQVQLTTNLLPGVVSYNLTETGTNTNIFQNFTASMSPGSTVAVNPTDQDDGVFYVRLKGFTLPAGQTVPLAIKVGVNDPNLTMSTPSGITGYVLSSKILLIPPGSTATYAGITTVTMDTLHSKIWTSFLGQTSPNFSSAGPRLPAFLSVGYVTASQASSANFDPNAHLAALDAIIGKKSSSGTPPLLGYSNSQVISGLDEGALYDNLPNYSIFYIIGHSQGTHSDIGEATFDGFLVWNKNPNDTSGSYMGINFSKTPAGKVLVKPSFIQGVMDHATSVGTDVQPYNLVFINGCASTCATGTPGVSNGNIPSDYVNAFQAKAYVGWPLPVTLSSAANAALTLFTRLGNQSGVSDIVNNSRTPIQADEAPTDYQTANGVNIALLVGTTTLHKVTLEELGTDRNVIIDNTLPH